MSFFISRHCEYAIQALLVLATKEQDSWTVLADITDLLKAPEQYMAKILQDMTRKGILESQKGPHGGFKLAKPANKIILFDVIDAIDGTSFLDKCVLGFSKCSIDHPCPERKAWEKVLDQIKQTILVSSIEEMAERIHKLDSFI